MMKNGYAPQKNSAYNTVWEQRNFIRINTHREYSLRAGRKTSTSDQLGSSTALLRFSLDTQTDYLNKILKPLHLKL